MTGSKSWLFASRFVFFPLLVTPIIIRVFSWLFISLMGRHRNTGNETNTLQVSQTHTADVTDWKEYYTSSLQLTCPIYLPFQQDLTCLAGGDPLWRIDFFLHFTSCWFELTEKLKASTGHSTITQLNSENLHNKTIILLMNACDTYSMYKKACNSLRKWGHLI